MPCWCEFRNREEFLKTTRVLITNLTEAGDSDGVVQGELDRKRRLFDKGKIKKIVPRGTKILFYFKI